MIPIDTVTNTVGVAFNGPGGNLQDIVMSADQAPVAHFSALDQVSGLPTHFDASESVSPVGTIVSYEWDFGDGTTATTPSPLIDHTYTTASAYEVTLTVTNTAGTSSTPIFSSRYLSNNGGSTAVRTKTIQSLPLPPTHLRGYQERFQTPSEIDIVNVIKWKPPVTGGTPAFYKIYRDYYLTDLVHTLPGNAPLVAYDHNRLSHTTYPYYIVSVSPSGEVSEQAMLVIDSRF